MLASPKVLGQGLEMNSLWGQPASKSLWVPLEKAYTASLLCVGPEGVAPVSWMAFISCAQDKPVVWGFLHLFVVCRCGFCWSMETTPFWALQYSPICCFPEIPVDWPEQTVEEHTTLHNQRRMLPQLESPSWRTRIWDSPWRKRNGRDRGELNRQRRTSVMNTRVTRGT